MTQSSGMQSNCTWQQINTKWARENKIEAPVQKVRIPGPWRKCCECGEWADEAIVNSHVKGYTCFNCLHN